jgi:hypothetical protein
MGAQMRSCSLSVLVHQTVEEVTPLRLGCCSASAILPMAARKTRRENVGMLPLSDGVKARRFPVVNIAIIVANFTVWLSYELPNLDSAVTHASFYPCAVDNACHAPEPWGIGWITAMFPHGGWDLWVPESLSLVLSCGFAMRITWPQ